MKHNTVIRRFLCLVLVMLLAAAALTLTGCQNQAGQVATSGDAILPSEGEEVASPGDVTPAGDELHFTFEVTLPDGTQNSYSVNTTCSTVGEALLEQGLIAGEDSQYGLYVTTVDGCTLDWDTDHMYWAFYTDGEYAMTGVDATEIVDGATYAFVATPG